MADTESNFTAGASEGADDTAEETSGMQHKTDDSFLAVVILIIAVLLVIIIGLYIWRSKSGSTGDNSWKQAAFSPPVERAAFIEAKKKLNPKNISELDELKKLLMRRAIQTIPYLLSLQNEGSSIERLYKRGMLTDDMHFKVKELKAFVDKEFQDVQEEAEDLVEGWGQHVWPQAMQFHQMIQKQAESKTDEQKSAEEEKKKTDAQKKKEKNKKSKASAATTATTNATQSTSNGKDTATADDSTSVPSTAAVVATAATTTAADASVNNATVDNLDPAAAKAQEAERMAQLLLEEEEMERKKASGGGKKSKSKK